MEVFSTDPSDKQTSFSPDSSNVPYLDSTRGFLYKWTNIITGWRRRYFCLENFTLSYFLCKDDMDTECRGSLNVNKCIVEVSKYDDCAFTLRTKTSAIHLKTDEPDERGRWVDAIHMVQQISYSPTQSDIISRSDSVISFSSTISNQSIGSNLVPKESFNLERRISEMHNFMNQIHHHVESMQNYFDGFKDVFGRPDVGIDLNDSDKDDSDRLSTEEESFKSTHNLCETCTMMKKIQLSTDFGGEALGFRTVASGLMATMTHCIEAISSREKMWMKSLKRSKEKNKILSEKCKKLRGQLVSGTFKDINAMKEGPDMAITEEQFIDALDSTYEIEEKRSEAITQAENNRKVDSSPKKSSSNPYKEKIKEKLKDCCGFLTESVKQDDSWTLCVDRSPILVFKKFVVKDNIVLDPYRATSIINNVTAKEITNIFWDPKYKYHIDTFCEKMNILENYGDSCILCHQFGKTIWPASQRDVCFISHMKVCDAQLTDAISKNMSEEYPLMPLSTPVGLPYMITNFSVDHERAESNGAIRAIVDVGFLAQTYTHNKKKHKKYDRTEIFTKISYFATINPGGWLPVTAVRTIAKRELAKFIENIGNFARTNTADQNLIL